MTNNYLFSIRVKDQNIKQIEWLLKFNEHNDLVSAEVRNLDKKMTSEQREWLWGTLPKTVEKLESRKALDPFTVTKLESDLSFEAFWDLYAHKVGNRKRAEGHWKKLDDATRAMVMNKVKQYNYWMQFQTHAKVFPERFLAQQRYLNDFTV